MVYVQVVSIGISFHANDTYMFLQQCLLPHTLVLEEICGCYKREDSAAVTVFAQLGLEGMGIPMFTIAGVGEVLATFRW